MANALADVHVKVDKNIKIESEEVLKKIGISLSDLINMTLRRVVYERQIPFDTKISTEILPENMRIETKEQLLDYLKKGIEEDDGSRYSIEAINTEIQKKSKEYEKICS